MLVSNRAGPPMLHEADIYIVIGDKERSLQCGMDDHITKPLRRNDLINTIGKLGAERKAHLMRSRWLHRAPVFR